MSPTTSCCCSAFFLCGLCTLLASTGVAQAGGDGPGWQVGGVLAASRTSHGGVGAGVVLGGRRRLRVATSAAVVTTGAGAGARIEVHAQFHVLPGTTARWSVYGTGGAGYLSAAGVRGTPFVVVGVGVERRPGGRRSEFVELGLGRGVRIAVGLRFRPALGRQGS